jgi:hypothetical protein
MAIESHLAELEKRHEALKHEINAPSPFPAA